MNTLPKIEWQFLNTVNDRCEGSSERGAIGRSEDGRYWEGSGWFRHDELEEMTDEVSEITEEEYGEIEKSL